MGNKSRIRTDWKWVLSPKGWGVVGCRKVEGFGFPLNGRRTSLAWDASPRDFVCLP